MDERGVQCKGCAEKADLVKRVEETYNLPVREKTIETAQEDKGNSEKPSDQAIDEMIKKMQKEMGQKFSVFRPGDLKDLTDEQLNEKFAKMEL